MNAAIYDGPVWREHAATMNARLVDHTDVLFQRPLTPDRGLRVMLAVDPVQDIGASRGVLVAHVLALTPDAAADNARCAEPVWSAWREAGLREAGALISLDVPNDYPRLPYRMDGPHIVWWDSRRTATRSWTRCRQLSRRQSKSCRARGRCGRSPNSVFSIRRHARACGGCRSGAISRWEGSNHDAAMWNFAHTNRHSHDCTAK